MERGKAQPRARSSLFLASIAVTTSILALISPSFAMLATVIAWVIFGILAERLTRELYHHFRVEGVAAVVSRLFVVALALAHGFAISILVFGGPENGVNDVWLAAAMPSFIAGGVILGGVTPLSDEVRMAMEEASRRLQLIGLKTSVDERAEQEAPLWMARLTLGMILALYSLILASVFAVCQEGQTVFLAVIGVILLLRFFQVGRRSSALTDAVAMHGQLGSLPAARFSHILPTLRIDLLIEVLIASFWVALRCFGILGTLAIHPWPDRLKIVASAGPFELAELHLLGMLLRKIPSLMNEGHEGAPEPAEVGVLHLAFFMLGNVGLLFVWLAVLADNSWLALGAVVMIGIAGVGYWMAHVFWRGGSGYRWLSGRLPWHCVFVSGLWILPAVAHDVAGLSGTLSALLAITCLVYLAGYRGIGEAVMRLGANLTGSPFGSKSVRFLLGWLPVIVVSLFAGLALVIAGERWVGIAVMGFFFLLWSIFLMYVYIEGMRGGSNEEQA